MRLGIIACEVFARELSAILYQSSTICSVCWLPQGLHDTPDLLRERLQKQIDTMQEMAEEDPDRNGLDAIVLAYGVCGGATTGLHTKNLPLVIPRTEDCIGLLLGGAERYQQLFSKYKGIYWLSCGWCERANLPGELYYTKKKREYAARFGEENAQWLLDQENSWISRYTTLIYIEPPLPEMPNCLPIALQTAQFCGWKLLTEQGDNRMLERLVSGKWEETDFRICLPKKPLEQTISQNLLPND